MDFWWKWEGYKESEGVVKLVYYYWDVFKWKTEPVFWQKSYWHIFMIQVSIPNLNISAETHTLP